MGFRVVPGFPNYKINRAGQVYSIKSKRFIKEKPGGTRPYPRIILYKEGIRYHLWLHRLNCQVWVGPIEGKEVHHKDGDTYNYHANNLTPLTRKEHLAANRKMREKRAKELSKELKVDCPF
jgi:hypothetical protein